MREEEASNMPTIPTQKRLTTHILKHWRPVQVLQQAFAVSRVALPPSTCGCNKFQLDALGEHVSTCTAHSGAKKTHDWAVEKIADLFPTTHTAKTQQVAKSWGQGCGDIELASYLADAVLDLSIAHERWGSSSNPSLIRQLHSPTPADKDRPQTEAVADKTRDYRADYNNRPSNLLLLAPLAASTVSLCASFFLQVHRETLFTASGVLA